jgi:hypothetical protein
MNQTRQPVRAIKQSIYLDVYGHITQGNKGKFAVLVPFFSSFFAAAIESTNEANKAAGMRH